MPITPTFPGVYIEELRSGVRTITGVSTSVAAFVGHTKNGPLNKAEEILSFADFERKFGGLAKDSPLSYTVQHFFINGGQQAYVVRLAQEGTAKKAVVTLGYLKSGTAHSALLFKAREAGASANGMAIRVDYNTAHPDSTFNLRVEDSGTGRSEAFLGVTMNANSRRNVDSVINATSQLIEVETDADGLAGVRTNKGKSESGGEISHTVVDADHRQFMITLDENDGPQLVTIYDGSTANRPSSLTDLAHKITTTVQAINAGEAYQAFACQSDIPSEDMLTLVSGEKGAGSFVRVTSAGAFDAARVLKLGVTNGGREVDAAAAIRPAPVGTTSGSLRQLPSFSSDRKLLVTLDGDGPHEVSVFRSGTDSPPAELNALRLLLRERLRQIKPNRAGSMSFMGIESEVVGSTIQILSGAEDNNSRVQFDNIRVLKSLSSVWFVSADDGWAVGKGTILKTNDGGTNWTPQTTPSETTNLRGVFRSGSQTGWVVGDAGTILKTEDGGQTWAEQDPSATAQSANFRGIFFKNDNLGLAVGEGGTILRTEDGGDNWDVPEHPAAEVITNLQAVFFRSGSQTAWAVGEGGTILKTTDDGDTWTPQTPPGGVTTALHGVHFLNVNNGWAVGEGGTILKTEDGGQTWTEQDAPEGAQNANLQGVFFRSNTLGWAVGDNGTILTTTDGTAWTSQSTRVTDHLYDVHFANDNNGWAVGDNGTILFWDGDRWSLQQAVTDTSATDLQLTDSTASQNVKAYTVGVGKPLGSQSRATPGQDGLLPRAADFQGSEETKSGIHALLDVDLFNILCLPGVTDFETNDAIATLSTAVSFCERRRAFCIIDSPESWTTLDDALDGLSEFNTVRSKNAAMYFPRAEMPDPLDDNRLRTFPPCGIVAGIYARTDATRGVWKAPAGQEASLTGVRSLVYKLTDGENGLLNPLGLNCLRVFPIVGPVNWGARTLQGADVLTSEWKYIPVRRLALFLEESLYRGTQWVVFEPNDEPLWSQIRLNVGAFMQNLFRQGAFQGRTPQEAYFVKSDNETTTQNDIDLGIVNIVVGFAPLKPAEFVIIKIQQMAGQIET